MSLDADKNNRLLMWVIDLVVVILNKDAVTSCHWHCIVSPQEYLLFSNWIHGIISSTYEYWEIGGELAFPVAARFCNKGVRKNRVLLCIRNWGISIRVVDLWTALRVVNIDERTCGIFLALVLFSFVHEVYVSEFNWNQK